ncbi:14279_t:CDS:1, partial [Funneliformis caledonium]
ESQVSVTVGIEAKGTVQKVMMLNTNFTIWESNGDEKLYIN